MRLSFALPALIPAASAAIFQVKVGANNMLAFDPPSVTAAAGDTIAFVFQSKNHTVTQSTFADPCSVMTTPKLGLSSGFQAVLANAIQFPSWSFTLEDDRTPLWFYCAQDTPVNHCHAGMVFAVNPTADKTFGAFLAAAKASATGARAARRAPPSGSTPPGSPPPGSPPPGSPPPGPPPGSPPPGPPPGSPPPGSPPPGSPPPGSPPPGSPPPGSPPPGSPPSGSPPSRSPPSGTPSGAAGASPSRAPSEGPSEATPSRTAPSVAPSQVAPSGTVPSGTPGEVFGTGFPSGAVDPPTLTGSAAVASSTAQGNGAPRMGGSFANVFAAVGLLVGLTL
ncbi:uncharacterized protein LACBIDRAFT_292201 [Laccaria bicolor S238N-H82]|uniref:Predicted protein n=1 Tax=Laccaria bicolor (strain S238N-H82 / ATCC MYA-4686) TaxID=486041 RepID=B0CS37_LACBS|nr:uncharacterized protein LACBIDRAFT_292201 [Laccaria bicolor S238N-H82]EDR14230.1 predicted protein [Laccaria bicolor S238N-H82]|eukprot:XP_001874789.1 predicted protein [Laccaria bicolor S238N-H82]